MYCAMRALSFETLGPDAVRQQAVEDQKIAGLGHDRHDFEAGCVGFPGIAVGGLRLSPLLQSSEQFRYALESANFRLVID